MKKILLTLMVMLSVSTFTIAQETEAKPMTKEEKKIASEKKEAAEQAMYKEMGLTETQIAKIREIQDNATRKWKLTQAKTDLTEDQKKEEKKKIFDEKSKELKEYLGAEKYKQMTEIKKRQKAESEQKN